jgi:hypothetical protein
MCSTMCAASAPTPTNTDDGSECSQGSPTAYSPGYVVTPLTCRGYLPLVQHGEIHPAEVEPVAGRQTTALTPAASRSSPALVVRANPSGGVRSSGGASMPAAAMQASNIGRELLVKPDLGKRRPRMLSRPTILY